MASNTLQYLKTDYQSHKDALLQRVRARWSGSWNDFLTNSFGIVLVDIVAWSTALLAYTVNRIAGESFVSTMTLRESAVRIGSLVGYTLRGPTPATVVCEASISSAQSADVTILKGTVVRTSDSQSVAFEVSQDYTILAGALTPTRTVAVFSPALSGDTVIGSFVSVESGSVYVDLVDTSVNLADYVEAGQTFSVTGDSVSYTIQALQSAPGSSAAFTRLLLSSAYSGATATVSATVTDQRIVLTQGQTVTDRFTAPVTNPKDFVVSLSRTPVIDGSVVVTVDGELWQVVATTDVRDATDRVCVVKTVVSGQVLVVFGDDAYGAAVPAESAIQVTYRTGAGSTGNIALGSINTSLTGIISSLSSPVPVSLTNLTSTGKGGRDAETLEEARVNIPQYTRTNDRAVTLSDYQALATQFTSATFGSVAYARTAVRTTSSFFEGNIVAIYAWTTGASGGLEPLSSAMKQALKDYLQAKAVGTDLVEVWDGTSRPVPISLRFRALSGYDLSDVRQQVSDTLDKAITSLRPGDPIELSNLVRSLDEVTGVDTVTMATPTSDLTPLSDTELFTVAQDDYTYTIERSSFDSPVTDSDGLSVSSYAASLPVFPLQVWSVSFMLGSNALTFIAHSVAGYGRLFGQNISNDDNYPSTVNLLTGQVTLWLVGAPGDFKMQLVSVQGCASERAVNVYVGYTGENTQTKRREIRSALRSYSDGMGIGNPVYARRVTGVYASRVSITDVVAAVSGVDVVTRVALDTPGSNVDRVIASDTELLRLANIVINNNAD